MNQYTIHCTPSQTKKALELGAPIEIFGSEDINRDLVKMATAEGQLEEVEKELNDNDHATIIVELVYCIPTAEQMINWLETQKRITDIDVFCCINSWAFSITDKITSTGFYPSRKEATLAAIDAALEYLSNNKI